jgi:hypothetical protein
MRGVNSVLDGYVLRTLLCMIGFSGGERLKSKTTGRKPYQQ